MLNKVLIAFAVAVVAIAAGGPAATAAAPKCKPSTAASKWTCTSDVKARTQRKRGEPHRGGEPKRTIEVESWPWPLVGVEAATLDEVRLR